MDFSQGKCSVLISSCDSYKDLWPIFFYFLFKQWPEVPTPVYLISNYAIYDDPRVKSLCIGEDKQWASNMALALGQINTEWVLFLQEDFLLCEPVNERNLAEVFHQLNTVGARFLEVNLRSDQGDSPEGTWLREANKENLKAGLNATLWKREFLSKICEPGLNIWQAETRVRDCLRRDEKGIYHLRSEAPHIIAYEESVKGQFWKPNGILFLERNGLKPDLSQRPYPPQGEGLFSKLIRSYYKRKMRILGERRKTKDRLNPGQKIKPLDVS